MKAASADGAGKLGAHLGQIARQMLAYGRPIPLDEIVGKVDAVTVASARAAGRALIGRSRPAIAALGPGNSLASAAAIAESLVRPGRVIGEHTANIAHGVFPHRQQQ